MIDLGYRTDSKTTLVKIGFSKNPAKRLITLQSSNPFCNFIACTFIRKGAKRFEAYLQRFNEQSYFKREVFELEKEQIEKSVAEMNKYGRAGSDSPPLTIDMPKQEHNYTERIA
jgi:hypothetical protein